MSMIAALFPPDWRSMEVHWRYSQTGKWKQKSEGFCACGEMEAKSWPPMCACARVRGRVVSAYYNSIAPFHPFDRWLGGLYLRIIAGFAGFYGRGVSLHSRLLGVCAQAPVEQGARCKAQNSAIVQLGDQQGNACFGQKGACCAGR
jgi:hypothetical protein